MRDGRRPRRSRPHEIERASVFAEAPECNDGNDDASNPARAQSDRITQMKRTTNPPPSSSKILALRSASTHCAQSRLLLLREAIQTGDPDLELELRDMAGVLAHVINEIEQLGRRTR